MKLRMLAVLAGGLAFATSAWAQGIGSSAGGGLPGGTLSTAPGVGGVGVPGQVAGGTLSTKPGVGGVGVPGQVAGGTLSTQPGVGGVGVPAQVPGGTLGTTPPCADTGCAPFLFIPGLVTPVPGAPADDAANASDEGVTSDRASGASTSPDDP
jgi:hypothetical protein